MVMPKELLEALMQLSALHQRTEDVRSDLKIIESKYENIIERINRTEAQMDYFRASLKIEISEQLKADLSKTFGINEHDMLSSGQ